MDKAVIGLADAIDALRTELISAIDTGLDERMRFSIEPVELSIQVGVTKDANGKIGWKVIELGGSYESSTTQTLTLKLAPMWRLPDGTLTRDFTVASVGTAEESFGQQH
ncbi:trypco2 family protein [Kribbella endophytica]